MGGTNRNPDGSQADARRPFLGSSAATVAVNRLIDRAARVNSTVLITGESGVGKEVVAQEIHARSKRREHKLVAVNCSAIPETLIEAELFGSEKGAFTDAVAMRRGAFEQSNQGTLFLDEVGDLSPQAQPKLLRVLESGEVTRVGGEQAQWLDLRVIAATNQRLKQLCRDKRFRLDLYWRLCVIEIHVPPLRDRREDVRVLANLFATRIAEKTRRSYTGISERALRRLEAQSWPGNVRELRSVVERALALSSGCVLDADCFELDPVSGSDPMGPPVVEKDWRAARAAFEVAYVKHLLRRHSGNVQKAARAAGLAPASLYKMLRRSGLGPGGSSNRGPQN